MRELPVALYEKRQKWGGYDLPKPPLVLYELLWMIILFADAL